jgi:zinc protease
VEPTPPVPSVPAPEDPAPITDGDVTVAYENGLRIVVKRNVGSEIAAMQLYIKGGARFRTKDNAGAELLALRVATRGGTTELDKDAFTKRLTAMGSHLGASGLHGYSVIAAASLTEQIDDTFALLASAFLSPAMPESEIEQVRQAQLVGIKRREVTPDGRLSLLVRDAMYRGHPYENLPDGTVESVSSLSRASLMAHLQTLRVTSRLQLVVVGDVEADRVRQLVRTSFGKLPRGDYQAPPLPRPAFAQPKLSVTAAELPTNYIQASFIGPGWSDPDFAAGILAMKILHNRVWEEVRTKRNLSYAPAARYSYSGEITRGALYVTAVDANAAMAVMLEEAKLLESEPIRPKTLTGTKSIFLTGHLMGNESTHGQAEWLAICDIVGGDWKLSRDLPKRIAALTVEDLQAFARKRLRNLQTVVLGDPTKLDQKLLESL